MIIGVTGIFSAGKSLVSKKLAKIKKGVLLDTDKIARAILDKDKRAVKKVIGYFGDKILDKNKKIKRRALADIVFSDKKKLKALCDIIHPRVISVIKQTAKGVLRNNKFAYVIIDAPVLIEAGMANFCDVIIVVTASVANILKRARKEKGFGKKQAHRRIKAQMPVNKKKKYADYIIRNNSSIKNLEEKIRKIAKEI